MKRTWAGVIFTCAAVAACSNSSGSPASNNVDAAMGADTSSAEDSAAGDSSTPGDSSSPSGDSSTASTDGGMDSSAPVNDGDGGNTVVGTLNGSPLAVGGGLGNTETVKGANVAVVALVSATDPNLCADVNQNVSYKNAHSLIMVVAELSAITTGMAYPVSAPPDGSTGPGLGAEIQYGQTDGTCGNAAHEVASGGSITFSTISGTALVGTFSATFPGGDAVSGSFNVPICAALGSSGDGGAVSCM